MNPRITQREYRGHGKTVTGNGKEARIGNVEGLSNNVTVTELRNGHRNPDQKTRNSVVSMNIL